MKILVIEDDEKCLDLIATSLRREAFTVDVSQDGIEGFSKAQRSDYELIILDIMLPGKSGFEVISGLRSMNNPTPIMVVSGRSMIEDRVLGLNLGADDYLTKCFSVDELLARTKNLLRRRGSSGKNFIRHKDLVINFSSMQVSRDRQKLQLTRKEMAILLKLLRHKNHVVSREDLTEAVWGETQSEINSNTIDVHVKGLRAKIDRPFEKKILRTVRGFGYVIED